MSKCAYCNSTIIIGGVREGDLRFCNQKCHQAGALLKVAQLIPDIEVRKRVDEIHQGPCPQCQKVGSVDVHTSHFVWSALVITSWKSSPQLSCGSCGKKAKIKGAVGSFFLGWWGFPWGFIVTPIQVGKNLFGLTRGHDSFKPSDQLERIVRLRLAADLRRAQVATPTPPTLKK